MWKNRFFKSFSDFDQKSLNKEIKITRRIVKTAFKVFRGTILGLFSRMKKPCSSFLVVERKYWTFGVIFWSNFSKLQPTGAAWGFEIFLDEKRNCLIFFRSPSESNSLFAKKLWRGCQNYSLRVRRNSFSTIFLRERNLAQVFWSLIKIIELLAGTFWQSCQNCSLRAQPNVWKFFLEGRVSVRAFWSVSESIRPSAETLWQGC